MVASVAKPALVRSGAVHLLNTRRKKNGRRTGWELVWAVNGEFTDQNKERWTPVTHKYQPTFQPWIEVVEFQELLPITIEGAPTVPRGAGWKREKGQSAHAPSARALQAR